MSPLSPRRRRLLAVVAGLVVVGACARAERPAATDSAALRPAIVEVDSGEFADGDEQVTWRRVPGTSADVVFEEVVRFGDDGVAQRRYVFTTDLLFVRFTEQRTQTIQLGNRTARPQRVDTEMDFDDQGVVRHARMVDGEVTELAPFDIEAVQRRALVLLRLWHPKPTR